MRQGSTLFLKLVILMSAFSSKPKVKVLRVLPSLIPLTAGSSVNAQAERRCPAFLGAGLPTTLKSARSA